MFNQMLKQCASRVPRSTLFASRFSFSAQARTASVMQTPQASVPEMLANMKAYNKAAVSIAEEPVDEIERINNHLRGKTVDEVLQWAVATIPHGQLVQLTSFGPTGLVITHKLHALGLLGGGAKASVPIWTIDTLHLFPETYAFLENVQDHYKEMDLTIIKPDGCNDAAGFDAAHGEGLWKSDPVTYGYLAKVQALSTMEADRNITAQITGRRQSQGGDRAALEVVERDSSGNGIKLNPLAMWSYDEVWAYLKDNKVPYNPLYDKGYKSLGDWMTSNPVDADTPERAGRFAGTAHTECGIHNRPKRIKK